MQQPQQAYNLLLEISEEMRPLSYQRKIVEEQFLYDVFTRKDTGRTSVAVKNLEYTSVTHEALQQMSAVAALFVVREILPQIKMYNMLWHRPVSKKSHERAIISELLREKIIFRTETTGIYLVNPIKIWRGNPITSVEATKDLLRTHRKPSLDIIKDLRPGDKYERTSEEHMRSIERDGFHPKLLS